jgi:hypothetical protein
MAAFSRNGFSFVENQTIGTSLAAFAVTNNVSSTGGGGSATIPDNCNFQSVEVFLTSVSSVTEVTMYLARDSTGDVAITPGGTSGATQTISTKTANTGSCVWSIDADYNFDRALSGSTSGTIYVVLKADAGSAVADVRVNWRA